MAESFVEYTQSNNFSIGKINENRQNYLFETLSKHLNYQEVKFLVLFADKSLGKAIRSEIKDGKSFFSALYQNGTCDDTNYGGIVHYLRCIRRYDLLHHVNAQQKRKYGEQMAMSAQAEAQEVSEPPVKKLRRSPRHQKNSNVSDSIKTTASVRLRVQAEYLDLLGSLKDSEQNPQEDPKKKQDLLGKAFEMVRSKDLGVIMCNVTFSELGHLDSFWSNYLNGSLLEALKGVFLTERLKEVVGNEPIRLLISVNQQDYVRGRALLSRNKGTLPPPPNPSSI